MSINLLPKNLRGRERKATPKDLRGASMEELVIPEIIETDNKKKQDKNRSNPSKFFDSLTFLVGKKAADKKDEMKDDNLEGKKREELEANLKKRFLGEEKKGDFININKRQSADKENNVYRPFEDNKDKSSGIILAKSSKPVIKEQKAENLGNKKMKRNSFWGSIFGKKDISTSLGRDNKEKKPALLNPLSSMDGLEKFRASKPTIILSGEKELEKKSVTVLPSAPLVPLDPKIQNLKKEKKEEPEKRAVSKKEKKGSDKADYNEIELDVKEKAKRLAGLKVGDKDVNFILEEYSGALKVKITKKISYLLAILIFLISVVFIFQLILDYRKSELRKTGAKLASENEKLKNEIHRYLGYKDSAYDMDIKLTKVKSLLDRHIYWSNLFNFLEDNTLENVYYVNFESGGTKQISLQARTTTFDNLSKQYELFTSLDEIEEVKIDSGTMILGSSGSENYVQFNVILIFKEDFFLR